MTARVVRLTEYEWRLFATVRLRALTDSFGKRDPQYQSESTFTAAQWRARLRAHAQFVAIVGDRAVGLIGAQRQDAGTVYLYSLWLAPPARGHGLARRLVAAAMEWAREQRAHTVRLRVAVDNAAARAVYRGLGFTVAADPPDQRDEIVMTHAVAHPLSTSRLPD